MNDLEQDPDYQKLLLSVAHPALELIVDLAKKRGIKEPRELWELFDLIGRKWRERRSCEGWGGFC